MSDLKAFRMAWKRTPQARTVIEGVRFAADLEAATRDAKRVVEEETGGKGVLLTVVPTYDPRVIAEIEAEEEAAIAALMGA